MSEIDNEDVLDNLRDIDANGTLLDMLLEFEHVFDKQGLYVYDNWKYGEVIEGPSLSRYWLYVKLMYPYKKMPDPKGARRLVELGCEVEFKKGILKVPVDVKSREDLDENNRPKLKKHKVWLIDVWMPRRFIDEFTDDKINVDGDSVDVDELNQAYDDGLDDETNIENQGGSK
jgi:hypothetical protein